jgi:Ca2+-binding EF-hand superfamily protein
MKPNVILVTVNRYRDDLTPRRAKMVEKAFTMLDRDCSGKLTISDISNPIPNINVLIIVSVYDVSMNPEFIEGKKSKD